MYEVLALGALLFIFRKLAEAGVPKKLLKFLFLAFVLWIALAFTAGFDFHYAEYDIFPIHFDEIIQALNKTIFIILLYWFGMTFLVDLLTRFKGFTKKKALCAFVLTLCITGYSMWEAYYVQPRYVTIPTRKLPEGTGKLRVVFLVDVHIGGLATFSHIERVMNIVEEAKPDILLLGGDVIDGDMSYRPREMAMLKEAAKNARYGAFAVNGNHEHYLILDEDVEGIIRECGYDLLIDERREVAGITLIGMEDIKYGWLKIFEKPEDKERFILVLKHRPGLPFDAEGRFDLMLAGHTHGGQFWPLGYFKSMALNSDQGLTKKAGGYVYVSNGSGFNQAMMRLFVPPEVTIIDIVRED